MVYDDEPFDESAYRDDDDMRDEYEAELAEKAIAEFTSDRLKSYYADHPELAAAAFVALEKAKSFLPAEPEAALVFADSAIEIVMKVALLKPVVYGLVHAESVASVVLTLIPDQGGVGHFQKLLFQILAEFGGVDLEHLKRNNSKQTLWEEIKGIRTARNHFLHQGRAIPPNSHALAVEVASEVVDNIFPVVIQKLGLHLHGSLICQQYHGGGFAPA